VWTLQLVHGVYQPLETMPVNNGAFYLGFGTEVSHSWDPSIDAGIYFGI